MHLYMHVYWTKHTVSVHLHLISRPALRSLVTAETCILNGRSVWYLDKSLIVYLSQVIEESDGFYWNPVKEESRSRINIPVRITGPEGSPALETSFLKQAESRGLISLKGHRSVGGLRISLFNAISIEETVCLRDFMIEFKESSLLESQ